MFRQNHQLLKEVYDKNSLLGPSRFYCEVYTLIENYNPSKNKVYDMNLGFFKFQIVIPVDVVRPEMLEARTKTKQKFLNFFADANNITNDQELVELIEQENRNQIKGLGDPSGLHTGLERLLNLYRTNPDYGNPALQYNYRSNNNAFLK